MTQRLYFSEQTFKTGRCVEIDAKCPCRSLASGNTICNLLQDEWHVEKLFKLANLQSSNSLAMSWAYQLKQQVPC